MLLHLEQGELFGLEERLPDGFAYHPGFISREEEAALMAEIAQLPLQEAQYKSYTAKRRIASFGSSYDFDTNVRSPAPPIADFLKPLRRKVAVWIDEPAEDFVDALVTEYSPAAGVGWHRDVPDFELIVGVSLGSACRMRFRPYPPERGRAKESFDLQLSPRSAYIIRDSARWDWQHCVPPVAALRYSITFRTRRPEKDTD